MHSFRSHADRITLDGRAELRITMDGADVANIGAGKTVTLEVPPGKHVLTAWIRLLN